MGKLTEILMWWEKVPNTLRARSIMKGWVYEVAEDRITLLAARYTKSHSISSISEFR
jgi:hypothetical protein